MSDLRQMPLFPSEPQTPADINRHTPLKATIKLFEQHLKKEGKSEHTIKAFVSDLALLGQALDENIPVGQFTTRDLNRFLHWLEYERGVPCSRKSYARRVTTLKVYFKWLKTIDAIGLNPALAVLQRSGPAPLADVLSLEQIRDCVEFTRTMRYKKQKDVQDYRPELLFTLLADTGLKKSEVMRLTPASIDRSNPHLPVLTVKHKARNVYKERRIDMDPQWATLLDLYLEQYQPKENIFECTARNLEYILTDIGEGAGIPFKLSFEVMRWTCAVKDHRLGMEDQPLREKMGLSETSWTETGAKIRKLAAQLAAAE